MIQLEMSSFGLSRNLVQPLFADLTGEEPPLMAWAALRLCLVQAPLRRSLSSLHSRATRRPGLSQVSVPHCGLAWERRSQPSMLLTLRRGLAGDKPPKVCQPPEEAG